MRRFLPFVLLSALVAVDLSWNPWCCLEGEVGGGLRTHAQATEGGEVLLGSPCC